MTVPNQFGTATSAIPLSQLDANFDKPITLGNTAIQLGNTVTTLNNMTLANVTISSGNVTITNVAITTANVSGTANISTLVVVNNATVGGNITAANANVTTNLVLSGGTASGVAYLNGSKVLTTGSALVFDGTNLGVGSASLSAASGRTDVTINGTSESIVSLGTGGTRRGYMLHDGTDLTTANEQATGALRWVTSAGEAMRIATATGGVNAVGIGYTSLTSVGNNGLAVLGNVGIGTSSPAYNLEVSKSQDALTNIAVTNASAGTAAQTRLRLNNGGSNFGTITHTGASFTTSGVFRADGTYVFGNGIGGLTLTTGAAQPIYFAISNSEVARFDASGNLGLGVTPSANAGQSTLNIANYNRTLSALTLGSNGNSAGYVGYNMGNTNTANTYRYIASDTGGVIYFAGNEMRFMQFASGSAGATTSGTQAMTLDSSGNLLVGSTSVLGTASGSFTRNNANNYIAVSDDNGSTYCNFGSISGGNAYIYAGAGKYLALYAGAAERARITSGGDFQTSSGGSVQVGGTAARATTAGTNRLDIFDGTAPVGTLANGVSFYSTAGEARVMDAAGNATLLSPHDTETNEWIFHSKHTPTGKVLRIDVERLLKFVNDHFGLDAVQEFIEP